MPLHYMLSLDPIEAITRRKLFSECFLVMRLDSKDDDDSEEVSRDRHQLIV